MASVFRKVYPNVTYISANAKRRLLQLPIVAVCIVNSAKNNQSELYLMKKFEI